MFREPPENRYHSPEAGESGLSHDARALRAADGPQPGANSDEVARHHPRAGLSDMLASGRMLGSFPAADQSPPWASSSGFGRALKNHSRSTGGHHEYPAKKGAHPLHSDPPRQH